MANLNKVMLIGRLTRDPECRTFSNGGKVAKFGFAVNNRKKNSQTGQWEDSAVFLDCEAFNRGETGKKADLVEQYLRKGHQVYLEGHLQLDEWTSQDGQKRSKIKIVVDNLEFLERREDGGGGGGPRPMSGGGPSRRPASPPDEYGDSYSDAPPPRGGGGGGAEEDIPF